MCQLVLLILYHVLFLKRDWGEQRANPHYKSVLLKFIWQRFNLLEKLNSFPRVLVNMQVYLDTQFVGHFVNQSGKVGLGLTGEL